jgi:pimeloyl-ACP methyl ester carboxylesterase
MRSALLEGARWWNQAFEAAGYRNAFQVVLHARGDAMVPFETGRQLAALIPGARFVPLESRNHLLLETEPAWGRFLEEVRAFLEA